MATVYLTVTIGSLYFLLAPAGAQEVQISKALNLQDVLKLFKETSKFNQNAIIKQIKMYLKLFKEHLISSNQKGLLEFLKSVLNSKSILRSVLEWRLHCIMPSEPTILRLVITKHRLTRRQSTPLCPNFWNISFFGGDLKETSRNKNRDGALFLE